MAWDHILLMPRTLCASSSPALSGGPPPEWRCQLGGERTLWYCDPATRGQKCTEVGEQAPACACCVLAQSCPTLCDPRDCGAPLFMGFSRQEYWSGLPFPSPEDLPDPGIESMSPALAGGFSTTVPPGKPALEIQRQKCTETSKYCCSV